MMSPLGYSPTPMLLSWGLTCMESELLGPCYKTGSQITHKQRVLRVVSHRGINRTWRQAIYNPVTTPECVTTKK